MKKLIIFLQTLIVFIGVMAVAFLLIEPHFEGRNDGATWNEVYFHDPFLAYAYIASIAFFVILFKIFKILGNIARGNIMSEANLMDITIIKYSSIVLALFAIGAEIYFFMFQLGKEDIIGGVVICGFVLILSIAFAAISMALERVFEGALNVKTAFKKIKLFRK